MLEERIKEIWVIRDPVLRLLLDQMFGTCIISQYPFINEGICSEDAFGMYLLRPRFQNLFPEIGEAIDDPILFVLAPNEVRIF